MPTRGRLLWARNTGGVNAVGGDEELIFGADATDRIVAWKTANGETAWTSERMLFRGLSAPASIGPTVAFGDFEGHVHFLDRKDGQPMLRLSTDGSAVVGTPGAVGHDAAGGHAQRRLLRLPARVARAAA